MHLKLVCGSQNVQTSPPEENNKDLPPSIKRNLPVLVISAFLIGSTWTITNSLMQPLVLHLKGNLAIVGIMVSILEFSMLLPMIAFGGYSDTMGRRRPILIACLFLMLAGILFALAPVWWWLIPAVLMFGVAFALSGPASSAAVTESVSASRIGSAFAYRNFGRLLAGIIASILGVIVISRGTIQTAFLLCAGLSLVNFMVIYFLLTETLSTPPQVKPVSSFRNIRKNLRIPPKLKNFYFYVVVTDSFSYGIGWHLIYGLLANYQGVDSQTILFYTLLASLVGGIVQLGVAGRVVDRTRKWSIVLSDSIAIPSILICALFPGKYVFPVVFVLMGIAMSFWSPAIQSIIVDHVSKERIATEFGILWGLKGVVGVFPPILGGILAEKYGYSAPLWGNVIFGIISLSVAVFLIEQGKPLMNVHDHSA